MQNRSTTSFIGSGISSGIASRRVSGILVPLALILVSVLFQSCKSSDFQDVYRRCSPECVNFDSPVPLEEVEESFGSVIDTVKVQGNKLTGRWVMLSTNHYVVDLPEERSITDFLFTKTLLLTEGNGEVSVSDCYNVETYELKKSGFTIPKDSVFFSSLYFENEKDVKVELISNKELAAEWIFVTPEGTEALVDATMFKVSDDDSAYSLGQIDNDVDIYCYSYLHFFSSGERLLSEQWVPAEIETKEMLLTIDPASGDNNLALGSERVNENTQYSITFDFGIEGLDYDCYGKNEMDNAADDFLAFEGYYDIKEFDSTCNTIHGHDLVKKKFSFTAL